MSWACSTYEEIKTDGAYEPLVFIKAGNFLISYADINISRKIHFTMELVGYKF
jgi:hypothetical protein